MVGFLYLALAFCILVFFYPELLGHPDNLIPANPYSTPQHIVPEWYFLWVYAILRSIPNKAMGVVAIALTFLSLISLPFLSSVHVGSPKYRIISERLFWVFVADVFLLTWVGAQEIMPATVLLGQVCTVVLFVYLWLVYPFLSLLENHLYLSATQATGQG
jgi:ubiquinol-cytochrome c reductase cytochrome b subunit